MKRNDIAQSLTSTTDHASPGAAEAMREALEAARLLEVAEDAHSNCPECEGEGVPELCEVCWPSFDEARLRRRRACALAGYLPPEFADGIAPLPVPEQPAQASEVEALRQLLWDAEIMQKRLGMPDGVGVLMARAALATHPSTGGRA